MKLKITSDGHLRNTQVVDAETGEALEMVQKVRWEVDAASPSRLARAEITVLVMPADIAIEDPTFEYKKLDVNREAA